MMTSFLAVGTAAADPAGGAALDQVALATGSATLALGGLGWLIARYRADRAPRFAALVASAERWSGLPGWAAVPTTISTASLFVAMLGMYWDISLHIDQGRDPGPLANPAHYLILAGLFGVFAAGALAIAMPREAPGRAAVTVGPGWRAPVGGVLIAACGAFALAGFPLDDMWHRLFGQDVTLWGPTHLMLIGGAGMTLIGQAVLLAEGIRARAAGARSGPPSFVHLRPVALTGGLLLGLSTFQAEFDFGVPQFRAVLQPALIALAAGVALVAARVWLGRGGALGAALFFLGARGLVALIVGPLLGETTPSFPLYLGEAVAIEAAALLLASRPVALGAAGGLLAGTAGFATEWGWSHLVMRLPWESPMLAEALLLAAVAGTAGGVLGALTGSALRGRLPRPAVARTLAAVAALALVAVLADGLYETRLAPVRAAMTVTPDRGVRVRLEPRDAARDATWLQVTAWQGGGLVVDRLVPAGADSWRTTRAIPLGGDWKVTLRLQRGRNVLGAPVRLPADRAIPVRGIPAAAHADRAFVADRSLLQRERRRDVPGWLWGLASLVVLLLALALVAALAWGLGRVARAGESAPPRPPSRGARPVAHPAARVGA